jgi:hypothetical protein
MTNVPTVEMILAQADDFANQLTARHQPPAVVEDVPVLARAPADKKTSDGLLAAQLLDLDKLFLYFAARATRAVTPQEADLFGRLALRCQHQVAVGVKVMAG